MNELSTAAPSSGRIKPRPRKPGRWISILLGFVIFICGIVLGGGGALILEKKFILHSLRHPEDFPGRMAERMQEKLDLSDLQTRQILEILTHRQQRLQKLQEEVQPRFEAEFAAVQVEISDVLNPEQARRYNDWFDNVRKTWTPPIPKVADKPSP